MTYAYLIIRNGKEERDLLIKSFIHLIYFYDFFSRYCCTEKNFTKFGLDKEWKILSTNEDINGLEFISTIESANYPFAAVQYHPEKNAYEWKENQNNPHTAEAILSTRHFFDWLVKEARKSNHSFMTFEQEYDALIGNISPVYTAPHNFSFEEVFFI